MEEVKMSSFKLKLFSVAVNLAFTLDFSGKVFSKGFVVIMLCLLLYLPEVFIH